MAKIDSTSLFLAQIKQQVSTGAPVRAAAQRTGTGRAGRSIQSVIRQRVLAIDTDDPERKRKAFRIFMESVLADELGNDLLVDPAYHQIVSKVCATIEQNDALGGAIDQAGEYLLQNARRH